MAVVGGAKGVWGPCDTPRHQEGAGWAQTPLFTVSPQHKGVLPSPVSPPARGHWGQRSLGVRGGPEGGTAGWVSPGCPRHSLRRAWRSCRSLSSSWVLSVPRGGGCEGLAETPPLSPVPPRSPPRNPPRSPRAGDTPQCPPRGVPVTWGVTEAPGGAQGGRINSSPGSFM